MKVKMCQIEPKNVTYATAIETKFIDSIASTAISSIITTIVVVVDIITLAIAYPVFNTFQTYWIDTFSPS